VISNCVSLNTETSPVPASLLLSLETILEPLDVNKLFPRPQPLQVELGSGDGSFLAQYAALHPERNFIGVERLLGRLRKLDRKGRRAGLSNLRGVRIEASYFLEFLLPKKSVTALHIYFPDPWPKRKHHKHRLINERFPQLAREVLVPGGAVYLRTDDAAYFAQMKAVFEACPFFAQIPTPQSLSEVLTDFERGFLAKGIQTLSTAWKLVSG
jgi:tRNA (guanine-N7-)-methyltransferase